MTKMNRKTRISGLALLGAALLSGCAGYPMGPSGPAAEPARAPASPLSGYFTDGRYYGILSDQNVIEDLRGNAPVMIAPACKGAARRAAVKAEWVAARTAPEGAPLPSSDVDDE